KENEINYDYVLSTEQKYTDNISHEVNLRLPKNIYTYKNKEIIRTLSKNKVVISLSNLLQEDMGIYDLKSIYNNIIDGKIDYIDLSSLVKKLKLRDDLIFNFEKLIYEIISIKSLKFIVEDCLHQEILKLFPMIFAEKKIINFSKEQKEIEKSNEFINIDKINSDIHKINTKFKGHSIFKKDFQKKLIKHSIFNKMNKKRILSVLLCGESGVGKTEFAKVVSNVKYPDEQLIKINFGNYSTEGVLNSLIGSPLGYIGSEDGGELINKISSSKTKVILID